MSKEGEFFIYLLERYADFKKQKASDILKLWDEADLTKLIYTKSIMWSVWKMPLKI